MALKEQLLKLSAERGNPCVTISLNTHRTHPDATQDTILLKNLLAEARERVVQEYGKRPVDALLTRIDQVASKVDANYNLDSLHLFLSNETEEIIRSNWPTSNGGVHISDRFAVRSLIKTLDRDEAYLIALISQSGVSLYEAIGGTIAREVRNGGFPFPENKHYNTFPDKGTDSKHLDDLVREYLNKVDKALVGACHQAGLGCAVICTGDNFSRLQQVADQPSIYLGHSAIDYNHTAPHQLAEQAWKVVQANQKQQRTEAIGEMKEAVAQGRVLTDLQEMYQAALDGNGDLLIVHRDFNQPVMMVDDRRFNLINDPKEKGAVEDITSNLAVEVLARKGRVVFTSQDEVKDLGEIALKTRY